LAQGQTSAQAAPSGSGKLAAIQITGSKRYSPDQIASLSGLHAGEAVRREDFQEAANRLGKLGVFSSVRYRFSSKGEDVTVEFQVEDAPAVPVSFDNFPWFNDAELAQAVKDSVILFDGTAPEQGAILDEIAQALEKVLPTRGVHGTVEHELLTHPDTEEKFQQFRIEGASLKVGAIEFSDPLAASDKRLQDRLPDIVGKPYSRYAIELFDFEQVRPVYLDHGRLRVRFGQPSARISGDPTKPMPDEVRVAVPVEPGPAYKWGGVTWSGNSVLASSYLDGLIGLQAGEPVDGMKLIAAWDRVRAAFGHRGYLDVKITPEANFNNAAAQVSYRVSIIEGPQYVMGDLILTGLSLEGERRLRASWHIGKGEILDRTYFDEFLAKGAKESFGDLPVHFDEIGNWLRTDPKTATVDVLLDFH
jgi:outer membrane protein assembly factor BamA